MLSRPAKSRLWELLRPILRDERRGTLHAIGVSRVSRWFWCRQFRYKSGKISEVIVGKTRCHLGHDLDHRIVLLGRRGPLLFAEHIELYQQIGRRLPAESGASGFSDRPVSP